jgi:hypothetical protein
VRPPRTPGDSAGGAPDSCPRPPGVLLSRRAAVTDARA